MCRNDDRKVLRIDGRGRNDESTAEFKMSGGHGVETSLVQCSERQRDWNDRKLVVGLIV